jgi:hypothetical protein
MKSLSSALLLVCIITVRLAGASERNPTSDFDTLKQATDRFMTALSKGEVSDAFNTIFKQYWYERDQAVSQAAKFGSQFAGFQTGLEQQFGKRVTGAYEFVGKRRLGKSMIRFVYILKYEKAPYPVGFSFYKARDEWKLNGIALGDLAAEDLKALNVTEPIKSS